MDKSQCKNFFKAEKSANFGIPSAFLVPFISLKTNKNTNNLTSFFLYFLFISVHHYLLATMHFMCEQRRATTIFLISIDAQLLGKERTNERFSGMLTDYGRPMKPFFIEFLNFCACADILGSQFCGIWGIFGQLIRTHLGTVSLWSTFSFNQPLFLQKTKAFTSKSQIFIWDWNWNWNLGHKESGIYPSCVRIPLACLQQYSMA